MPFIKSVHVLTTRDSRRSAALLVAAAHPRGQQHLAEPCARRRELCAKRARALVASTIALDLATSTAAAAAAAVTADVAADDEDDVAAAAGHRRRRRLRLLVVSVAEEVAEVAVAAGREQRPRARQRGAQHGCGQRTLG